jgi:hypothetical protein
LLFFSRLALFSAVECRRIDAVEGVEQRTAKPAANLERAEREKTGRGFDRALFEARPKPRIRRNGVRASCAGRRRVFASDGYRNIGFIDGAASRSRAAAGFAALSLRRTTDATFSGGPFVCG